MVNHRTSDERAAHLSAEDLAALRASLHEQRLFRREQLRQIGAAVPAPAHRPPHGREADGRAAAREEVRAAPTASARMVLADVEAALERMRQGRYGICPLCRGPIPLTHLVVVPQARYCGRCRQARGAGE
ncbi:TraR/DksA family transcriptional regulator [Actinacidiphila glaucinigra]|uniref:TraR/DksA family transcriptional regulator n=1 Tax=Actinacidiphila glaucinigra TaxID=235986 RepID=UPI0038131453